MRPIDADALIERIKEEKKECENIWYKAGICIVEEYIDEAPTVEQSRWIPCSERLPEHPENNDYYLVTIQCEHYDGWDDYVTGFAEWTKHGWDELSYYIGQIKVVAWMPLPKPYEEDE